MSMPMNLLFGDQTGGESQKVRNLRTIDSGKYNREFTQNIAGLNAATDYMAQYLIVMQKGIDDANKNIIQKIQDFIADLIIIFTGGSDTGFEFGDLGYIIQALGALFGFQGLDGPVNLLEAAAHFLGNFLQPLGLLGDIINGFIQTIFAFFASLLSNVPIVGDALEEIVNNVAAGINETTENADTAVTVVTTVNSTVQVILDGLPLRAYWETMNLTEESTFPRVLLQDIPADGLSLDGNTGSADGNGTDTGGLHSHSTSSVDIVGNITPSYTPPINTLEGGFVRCLYSGGRGIVTYIPDAVSSPCELYIVVGKMLSNGDVQILWVSANQTPLISATRFERTVELPSELVFSTGDSAVLFVHQRGSGNVRPLLGLNMSDIPRAPTVFPPQVQVRFPQSSVMSAGTVLAANTLDFTSRRVPYLALGKSLVTGDPIKLIFMDDFNTPPLKAVFAKISTQAAEVGDGVFRVSGGTDGVRTYLYAQSLNYDDQMVSGMVVSPSGRVARLLIRCTSDAQTGIALTVFNNQMVIDRISGGSYSALASWSGTIASGTEVRIKVVGTTSEVITVERKVSGVWTSTLTFTDSGNVLPSGENYRYTGLGTERQVFVNGGAWDYWRAEDL